MHLILVTPVFGRERAPSSFLSVHDCDTSAVLTPSKYVQNALNTRLRASSSWILPHYCSTKLVKGATLTGHHPCALRSPRKSSNLGDLYCLWTLDCNYSLKLGGIANVAEKRRFDFLVVTRRCLAPIPRRVYPIYGLMDLISCYRIRASFVY